MTDISKIDQNFEVKSTIVRDGLCFYDARALPFVISGLMFNGEVFHRMPSEIADNVSERVKILNYQTAGGRVRFKTDSKTVAIEVKYNGVSKMPHFAFSGSIGFDLYADNVYVNTYMPSTGVTDTLESKLTIEGESKMREITINFPLYSGVGEMLIGLDEGAMIEAPTPYINEKPVVYYGSSITQGGCASRPGTCYQAYVSREFNLDYVNLGFAGAAKAEDLMIEYIKGLDMSIFVYDYDHNASTIDYLIATHQKMFCAIRETHPTIPIIIMSRPKANRNEDDQRRLEIIKATYEQAKSGGDENVYFLGGDELTALCGNEGTVDNCHPTDFGFASMAHALISLIKAAGLTKKIKQDF